MIHRTIIYKNIIRRGSLLALSFLSLFIISHVSDGFPQHLRSRRIKLRCALARTLMHLRCFLFLLLLLHSFRSNLSQSLPLGFHLFCKLILGRQGSLGTVRVFVAEGTRVSLVRGTLTSGAFYGSKSAAIPISTFHLLLQCTNLIFKSRYF